MTSINPSSIAAKENQPRKRLIKALDWFVRFSQFYGEYESRAPKDRNRWVKELRQH
ncbi:MAG: hypothetical protein ACFB2W_23710 [Leptolyngbyaceae cyanobacterium]